MSDLASSIDVIEHIKPELSKSNLHTPPRYSAVLLSIGKTTHICHQNIPLKKIHRKETVTYVSAIPLKLEKIWRQSTGEIASSIVAVLQQRSTPSVWASIDQNKNHWIEFVISHRGMEQWRRQLLQDLLPDLGSPPSPVITAEKLWKLQAGYELCCRWQRLHHETTRQLQAMTAEQAPLTPFCLTSSPVSQLVHGLLDICDRWHEAQPSQLLHQANQLVEAIDQCTRLTPPASPTAPEICHWIAPTQQVLKQLLQKRFDHHLPDKF